MQIYADVPAGVDGIDYSRPGDLLVEWTISFSDVVVVETTPVPPPSEDVQGWFHPYSQPDPPGYSWEHPNHKRYFLYNIENISDLVSSPFIQWEGRIYWLCICVETDVGKWGWKTADVDSYPTPYTGIHFQDNAVYLDGNWYPLYDPSEPQPPNPNAVPLDLAFVITGKEVVIPAVSEWGVIVIGVLTLTVGALVISRARRRAAA